MTRHRKRSTASSTLGWQMRECPLSRHLGMEAPALPVPPTLAGAFHCGFTPRLELRSAAILAVSAIKPGSGGNFLGREDLEEQAEVGPITAWRGPKVSRGPNRDHKLWKHFAA